MADSCKTQKESIHPATRDSSAGLDLESDFAKSQRRHAAHSKVIEDVTAQSGMSVICNRRGSAQNPVVSMKLDEHSSRSTACLPGETPVVCMCVGEEPTDPDCDGPSPIVAGGPAGIDMLAILNGQRDLSEAGPLTILDILVAHDDVRLLASGDAFELRLAVPRLVLPLSARWLGVVRYLATARPSQVDLCR